MMNDRLNRSIYRETVQGSGTADGRVVRQRGGKGVYAHVRVTIRALSLGQGIVVVWNAGSNIPAKFAPAVLEGIRQATNAGVLAGLELTDVHISVDDGSYHDVDSTLNAFREAAEKAATEAMRQARPVILEAVSLVTARVSVKFVDSVEAVMNSRGGQIKATPSETPYRILTASMPTFDVNSLIAEVLQVTEGDASISSASAGFRPRPDPPETVEQWVVRS
jgi:elongation factor G